MRIVSWNIESLAPWIDGRHDFARHVEMLQYPDVICLQEIRLRPGDRAATDRARTLLPGYTCHISLSDDPRNVTFRGGRAYGVATYISESCGDTVAATPEWDREGRVLVTALPQRLAIVNLYAVNGTAKPYFDPSTGARQGDRHEHKQRFQDRLFGLARDLRVDANVVLIGDWNVSRSALDVTPRLRTEEPHATARAQLNARLEHEGWIDAFREQHPTAREYTWFGRTRAGGLDAARVDYAVVASEMWPHLRRAEILGDPALRRGSDHAPISITLAIPGARERTSHSTETIGF